MSVPAFLNSSYRYFFRRGVSDVQTIMDDFATETAAAHWSNPSTTLYKSPVDSDGRWFDVLLTRIAATKLEWRVRDQYGTTLCTRRMQIAGSCIAHILLGEYHAHISADSGVGWEYVHAGVLDQTPEPQATNTRYVFGNGSRSNTDTFDSSNPWTYAGMIDNATASLANRATQYASNQSYTINWTAGGNRIVRPWGMWARALGEVSNAKFHGRAYQCVMVPADISYGAKVTLPIDVGQSGLFLVSGIASYAGAKIAIRIG
ncbi:MAG: hypothetical protein LAP85_14955 [Acidobacteriia bacterium]|nr:hypothetical protein [Terriglobia bacterium]